MARKREAKCQRQITRHQPILNRDIALLGFTQQGAERIQNSRKHPQRFSALAKQSGVKSEGQYWTTGACDGVRILAADDATKILHLLAKLASAGNVRTESMRAFDATEFAWIVR